MKAYLKNYRQAPRKVRLIANAVRGKKVDNAIVMLDFLPKKAALPMRKLILSAVANAKENSGLEKSSLTIKNMLVDEGFVFKRYQPRARGRASQIRKKTSHVSIILEGPTGKEVQQVAPESAPKVKPKKAEKKPATKKVATKKEVKEVKEVKAAKVAPAKKK